MLGSHFELSLKMSSNRGRRFLEDKIVRSYRIMKEHGRMHEGLVCKGHCKPNHKT